MIKYNFIKTLTAGVALAIVFYPQAFAADTGSCGTNCVYTFENGTLTYSVADANANNGTGKITITNQLFGITDTIENVIVNEGITGVALYNSNYAGIHGIGTQNGKLVLPDNFSIDPYGMLGLGFGTIELGNNTKISDSSFRFNNNANTTIIINSDYNITFGNERSFSGLYPNTLNIACKGNLDACMSKFISPYGSVLAGMDQSKINADYYKGINDDGNYEEWSANGHMVYADSTKQKILKEYDINGNILNSWTYSTDGVVTKYDGSGKIVGARKNSPFTPAEAAALVKKGNNNTVTLTFK